jgi:Cu/Ag efflux protein CusF
VDDRLDNPMPIRWLTVPFALAVCSFSAALLGQAKNSAAKGIQFLGQIQAVDLSHKKVTVKHGAIPSFVDRGVADYSVDNESVLRQLKPGDDIRATVYLNDPTLRGIRIVSRSRLNQQKKSLK